MTGYRNLARSWDMSIKKCTGLAVAGSLLALCGITVVAQTGRAAPEKQASQIKIVAMRHTDASSGAQMYKEYCAVCHGMAGKGDGPAVKFLKTPPPDLRTLVRHHDGKFPTGYVEALLRSGTGSHADRGLDMPVWGPQLRSLHENAIFEEMRIYNLTVFVKSLQEK